MSLDQRHQQKVSDLDNRHTLITTLHTTMRRLEKQKVQHADDIFEVLRLDDEIHQIHDRVCVLSQSTETDYLMKVSTVLQEHNELYHPDKEFSQIVSSDQASICSYVEKKSQNKRGQLLTSYMHKIEGSHSTSAAHTPTELQPSIGTHGIMCRDCDVPMRLSTNESYIVCSKCGNHDVYFEPSVSGLTYEQELNTDTNVHFAYKRINHLRELLAQLQAKERSEIPHEVIAKMQAEFRKARVVSVNEVTQTKVKMYLKKLNLNKFYEHARQITNILSGKPPPIISGELYETLVNMFHDIQEPFEEVCPKNRKNFFSYSYILYKFCELLGEIDMMELFPLLKSREKLYQQDCIWRDICKITGWVFHKSV
jgi:rubrerythrin